jgi:hypothetical protein
LRIAEINLRSPGDGETLAAAVQHLDKRSADLTVLTDDKSISLVAGHATDSASATSSGIDVWSKPSLFPA